MRMVCRGQPNRGRAVGVCADSIREDHQPRTVDRGNARAMISRNQTSAADVLKKAFARTDLSIWRIEQINARPNVGNRCCASDVRADFTILYDRIRRCKSHPAQNISADDAFNHLRASRL